MHPGTPPDTSTPSKRYHLRREDRAILDPAELDRILSMTKYVSVALCGPDLLPHVVVMSHGYDAERNCLYFHSAQAGRKLDLLRLNPNVSALAVEDKGYKVGECSHAYQSVHVTGRLEEVVDPEEVLHALEVMIRRLEPEPEAVLERFLTKFRAGAPVSATILRLSIDERTGKHGS
jgi:nitroimidazol reductase NimA-like FMN-containing flavoprotein (pyridoxamine 5'-phosphate oxidase superfamily)